MDCRLSMMLIPRKAQPLSPVKPSQTESNLVKLKAATSNLGAPHWRRPCKAHQTLRRVGLGGHCARTNPSRVARPTRSSAQSLGPAHTGSTGVLWASASSWAKSQPRLRRQGLASKLAFLGGCDRADAARSEPGPRRAVRP